MAFRRGWDEGSEGRVSVPASRRAPNLRPPTGIPRTGEHLRPPRGPATVSRSQLNTRDAAQASRDPGAGPAAHPKCPRQGWYHKSLQMDSRVRVLDSAPEKIWLGQRHLNPSWQLLLAEINLA